MKYISKSEIRLNPANPRIIRDEKYRALVRSVAQFPKMLDKRGIVVDKARMVLGGNQRWRAILDVLKMPESELMALLNGNTETFARWEVLREKQAVPENWIVDGSDMTDDEIRRFIIADNVEMGEHDWDMLANQWDADELADWGLDVPDFAGGGAGEAQEDDYEIPDEIKTDIVAGDLFEIGPHRLLCGDSTKSEDVARLMDGDKADMVFTDPPYGMNLDTDYSSLSNSEGRSNKYSNIIGDTGEFNPKLISTIFNSFADTKEIFIFGADYFAEMLPNKNNGSWIVWDKRESEETGKNVDGRIGSMFELCWSKQKHKRLIARIMWAGMMGVKDDSRRVHPTQKPTQLPKWFFNNWGNTGDVVADLFLGSGTTMVASHQLNRKCYGMEIDPKYCQVIIDRMLKLDPTLEIKRNGQPYLATMVE